MSAPHLRLSLITHALGGAFFGVGLARYLFEHQPQALAILSTWPGVVVLTAVSGLLALTLPVVRRGRDTADLTWAPLALLLPLSHILAPDVNLLRGLTLLVGGAGLYVAFAFGATTPSTQSPISNLRSPLFLFLLLFSLYLSGLAPAVGEADTFEFQVGIARLGVAHGSGYPLLMLVGKVFSLLPIGGTLAWRANITSAFFGALAAMLVERIARRLGASPLVAFLAALTFGLSPTLWSRAVEVEAYPLNAALVAAILLLCLALLQNGHGSISVRTSGLTFHVSRLTLLAFLFGLSLTNHLTTLLLAPACAIAGGVAALKAKRSGGDAVLFHPSSLILHTFLAFLLGLSVYLYVPLRWPAVNNGQLLTLAQFGNILAGNEARGAFQWQLPFRDPGRWAIVFDKVVGEYGVLALALAALGVAALVWKGLRGRSDADGKASTRVGGSAWAILAVLAAAYAGYLYFGLAFNVPDPDFSAFFIPLHLIAALLMAVGLQSFVALTTRRPSAVDSGRSSGLSRLTPDALRLTSYALFALLPLSSLWTTLPRVDQSDDWAQQRLGEYILSQPLAANAAILADSQKIAPLYYLQVAEGRRPDLDILVLPDEVAYRAVLEERVAAGQVVYLARYLPGLGSGYSLRSVGPLAEVSAQPFTTALTAMTLPLAGQVADGVSLAGFDGGSGGSLGIENQTIHLTLYWTEAHTPETNLLVNLRLVNAAGEVAWRDAGSVPVGGLYPTNAWRPLEVISDYHAIPVTANLAPGRYRVEVALLPPFVEEEAQWTPVAEVNLPSGPSVASPSHALRARFGSQWLLGYDLPETAAPGARVPVTLYWLRGEAETVTALGETRSVVDWPLGAVVPMLYERSAPEDATSLPIIIDTGATARCGWLAPPTQVCALPTVTFAGQAVAEGAINFDNLLVLREVDLSTTSAPANGQVSVTLEWQGLQTLNEDYTVFVHLIGPDGLVHGQVDTWPVSGTRATSTWQPGEVITDRYVVPVAADAPPGDYQVEIGLYLLATGQRLAVLNADGAAIDDRVLEPGLTITP